MSMLAQKYGVFFPAGECLFSHRQNKMRQGLDIDNIRTLLVAGNENHRIMAYTVDNSVLSRYNRHSKSLSEVMRMTMWNFGASAVQNDSGGSQH